MVMTLLPVVAAVVDKGSRPPTAAGKGWVLLLAAAAAGKGSRLLPVAAVAAVVGKGSRLPAAAAVVVGKGWVLLLAAAAAAVVAGKDSMQLVVVDKD